jgi:hypothetical protein
MKWLIVLCVFLLASVSMAVVYSHVTGRPAWAETPAAPAPAAAANVLYGDEGLDEEQVVAGQLVCAAPVPAKRIACYGSLLEGYKPGAVRWAVQVLNVQTASDVTTVKVRAIPMPIGHIRILGDTEETYEISDQSVKLVKIKPPAHIGMFGD